MLDLELGNRFLLILGGLLLAQRRHILGHRFVDRRVFQGIEFFQAGDLTRLFTGTLL